MSTRYSNRQPSGCLGCLGIILLCLAIDASAIYAAIRLAMFVTGGAR